MGDERAQVHMPRRHPIAGIAAEKAGEHLGDIGPELRPAGIFRRERIAAAVFVFRRNRGECLRSGRQRREHGPVRDDRIRLLAGKRQHAIPVDIDAQPQWHPSPLRGHEGGRMLALRLKHQQGHEHFDGSQFLPFPGGKAGLRVPPHCLKRFRSKPTCSQFGARARMECQGLGIDMPDAVKKSGAPVSQQGTQGYGDGESPG